jgi:hypothetical protein
MSELHRAQRPFKAAKEAEMSGQSYHRWRKNYRGVRVARAKRFKELGRENTQLKRLIADLSRGAYA